MADPLAGTTPIDGALLLSTRATVARIATHGPTGHDRRILADAGPALVGEIYRLRAYIAEMETQPADGETPMPTDPDEARLMWDFLTAHARWRDNRARHYRNEVDKLKRGIDGLSTALDTAVDVALLAVRTAATDPIGALHELVTALFEADALSVDEAAQIHAALDKEANDG